jgi:hypothetical protein
MSDVAISAVETEFSDITICSSPPRHEEQKRKFNAEDDISAQALLRFVHDTAK